MAIVNPIWLWGMVGLVIPIAIHLLSRKDVRVIRMGSLRHLENAITRQAIRIRLNAYWLLALRCLIVALITLLLADLIINTGIKETRWLLIDNGLEQAPQWRPLIDSLEGRGFELRRLQAGFPPLNLAGELRLPPDYWTLATQLTDLELDHCIVISRHIANGFTGLRPGRDPRVTWLTSSGDSTRFVLASRPSPGDSVVARVGVTNDHTTSYTTLRIPASNVHATLRQWADSSSQENDHDIGESDSPNGLAPGGTSNGRVEPIRVVVSGTRVAYEERRVISAALNAVNGNGIVPIQYRLEEPTGSLEGDWLIWLSADEPPPVNIPKLIQKYPSGGVAEGLATTHDTPLLRKVNVADMRTSASKVKAPDTIAGMARYQERWIITQQLTAATAIRSQLALQLATVMLGAERKRLSVRESRFDHRRMPEQETFSDAASLNLGKRSPHQRKTADVLAVLIVLLFALERFIANRQQL